MSHYLLIQACFRAMACAGLGYSKATQPLPAGQDFPRARKESLAFLKTCIHLMPHFKMMLSYFLLGYIIAFGKK